MRVFCILQYSCFNSIENLLEINFINLKTRFKYTGSENTTPEYVLENKNILISRYFKKFCGEIVLTS